MGTKIELLSPAKNFEQGKAAINHGADALYIGAPAFGARVNASNSIEEIESLVKYAHLYGSKLFATVNTLLFDNEIEQAEKMLWQLYEVGVDAAIIQDLGLLELNLPPIELHASTQTHNIDVKRIKFLEQTGFKRIILARETSLKQMEEIRKSTTIDLEAFVQGALCVCYSGQCYMSLYLSDGDRSGNRGSCTQPCRSSYDLINDDGKLLRKNEHLLSLKDYSAAQHVENMIDAGITSFKIEGRLKDLSYVKNNTAYYRKLLDNIINRREGLQSSSSGKTIFHFIPDPTKTFNRTFTDYFLIDRHPMASLATQKSVGKNIGTIVSSKGNKITIRTKESIVAGDGMLYFDEKKETVGFLVNHVREKKNIGEFHTIEITANKSLTITNGTTIWRNNDYSFEKMLQGDSAERLIDVFFSLNESDNGFELVAEDEDGIVASESIEIAKDKANNAEKALDNIRKQLSKSGGTSFKISNIKINTSITYFIPSSQLNELRRKVLDTLAEKRIKFHHPKSGKISPNDISYYESDIDGRANVTNAKSRLFYKRHKVKSIESGPDTDSTSIKNGTIPLMTCKYCLRYELKQCLRHKCNNIISPEYQSNLTLVNNGKRFRLEFDCKKCEMKIYATK